MKSLEFFINFSELLCAFFHQIKNQKRIKAQKDLFPSYQIKDIKMNIH